jgi:excisionase family DNA binding protein
VLTSWASFRSLLLVGSVGRGQGWNEVESRSDAGGGLDADRPDRHILRNREDVNHLRAERDMERLLVSPEEAAELLDVARSTVYDLMRLRVLASVKVGRYRRIPMSKLREYLDHLTDVDVA